MSRNGKGTNMASNDDKLSKSSRNYTSLLSAVKVLPAFLIRQQMFSPFLSCARRYQCHGRGERDDDDDDDNRWNSPRGVSQNYRESISPKRDKYLSNRRYLYSSIPTSAESVFTIRDGISRIGHTRWNSPRGVS